MLITGISGFVGSNLARMLVDAKASVMGLDLVHTSPSLRVLNLAVPILTRTLTKANQVDLAMRQAAPEIVFHLGGKGHIHDCQQAPLDAWKANVQGTWNVLEACRKLPTGQIQAIVCASSDRVYGSSPTTLDRRAGMEWYEKDPPQQIEVYGLSKAMVDLLVRAYGKGFGLPVVSLRHQNAYGEADPHASHIVTGTIHSILAGQPPVIRSDGTAVKGFLYIRDVLSAYLLLAEYAVKNPGEAFNASPSRCVSVRELVDLILTASGSELKPVVLRQDLSQSGDVEILNSDRLRGLGWSESVSLEEGLLKTYRWYAEHGKDLAERS